MSIAQSKFAVYPTVGQVVNVLHQSGVGKSGVVKLVKAGRDIRTIKQVHIIEGGYPTITDNVGDVWSVKPSKLGEWETVIPE